MEATCLVYPKSQRNTESLEKTETSKSLEILQQNLLAVGFFIVKRPNQKVDSSKGTTATSSEGTICSSLSLLLTNSSRTPLDTSATSMSLLAAA